MHKNLRTLRDALLIHFTESPMPRGDRDCVIKAKGFTLTVETDGLERVWATVDGVVDSDRDIPRLKRADVTSDGALTRALRDGMTAHGAQLARYLEMADAEAPRKRGFASAFYRRDEP